MCILFTCCFFLKTKLAKPEKACYNFIGERKCVFVKFPWKPVFSYLLYMEVIIIVIDSYYRELHELLVRVLL